MHAVGMRVASAFHAPSGRSSAGVRPIQETRVNDARPDEVIRAQQLKRAGHLPAIKESLFPHHVFEERSWLSLTKSISSPASVKSVWAANRVKDLSRSSPSRAIAAAAIDSIVPRDNSRPRAPSHSARWRL